jgi:hypothetical protein
LRSGATKTTFRLISTLLISAVVSFSMPVFVHRRAYDSAFWDWYKNPTPATEQALAVQRRINRREKMETGILGTAVVFVGINGLWFIADHLAKRVRLHSQR